MQIRALATSLLLQSMFYGFDVSYQFSLRAFVPFARPTTRAEIEPEAGYHFAGKSKK